MGTVITRYKPQFITPFTTNRTLTLEKVVGSCPRWAGKTLALSLTQVQSRKAVVYPPIINSQKSPNSTKSLVYEVYEVYAGVGDQSEV